MDLSELLVCSNEHVVQLVTGLCGYILLDPQL